MRKNVIVPIILASAVPLTAVSVPAFADAIAGSVKTDMGKTVAIGSDLTPNEKEAIFRYFGITDKNSVRVIYVTNKDERDHLSSYIPLEQIGNYTVSCAYINPTQTGGIKVRTANLLYVTSNMIASTLSTSGVTNCEVIAACPFQVSGTGALTGIIMAYENSTGVKLDETKKNIATQEVVATESIAKTAGTVQAENIVNQAKIKAVQDNITDPKEIQQTIVNIANDNSVNITNEQVNNTTNVIQQIVQQKYPDDYLETLKETQKNIDKEVENINSGNTTNTTNITNITNNTDNSTNTTNNTNNTTNTTNTTIINNENGTEETEKQTEKQTEAPSNANSIMNNVDAGALGENVIQTSNEDPSLITSETGSTEAQTTEKITEKTTEKTTEETSAPETNAPETEAPAMGPETEKPETEETSKEPDARPENAVLSNIYEYDITNLTEEDKKTFNDIEKFIDDAFKDDAEAVSGNSDSVPDAWKDKPYIIKQLLDNYYKLFIHDYQDIFAVKDLSSDAQPSDTSVIDGMGKTTEEMIPSVNGAVFSSANTMYDATKASKEQKEISEKVLSFFPKAEGETEKGAETETDVETSVMPFGNP